ncbi:GNAT family N-acetyltransferase [Kutzneria buriramensis]|uniref:L-amino acid N-acyltransferase YncA n=1 Tax=Kutzneria buriramensis TaxID=1045776 RepID=A0A3E0H3R7_9PSEU|nr:GNAT family N-acetyltransferase [Kutzneria buriramensis]REH37179.1 L-amino acid N-acyltransferase YncA [Kutzneria buriramensis]
MSTEVRPADASRFEDVAAVLNPGGNDRACWCLSYRLAARDNGALLGERRADWVRDLCGHQPAPGVLAYVDGQVAGWCGVSPRDRYARLVRSRTIRQLDDRPVWSVVCFVVRPGYRRRGVTHALLRGAVEYAREQGAPAIEGYPVDPGGERIQQAAAYVGTTSVFEAAGFRRVERTQAVSDRRPRWLMRLDLNGPG